MMTSTQPQPTSSRPCQNATVNEIRNSILQNSVVQAIGIFHQILKTKGEDLATIDINMVCILRENGVKKEEKRRSASAIRKWSGEYSAGEEGSKKCQNLMEVYNHE